MARNIESLLEDAIELIESDWAGTSGSSPGNRWLAEARETLDEIKRMSIKCSHGIHSNLMPKADAN